MKISSDYREIYYRAQNIKEISKVTISHIGKLKEFFKDNSEYI